LFVNASVLDESGAPSRAPILLNFESPSQAEHHSTRQAPSEAEAGLCGQSEEVTAYKRHLAANVERILGQIEPDMDIPSCADSPISKWNAGPAAMANTRMKWNSSTSN
jgi:hypothetical protein